MLSAGGYDDQITGLDVLVDAIDGRFAFSRRECQDLVDGVFLRRWSEQEHQYRLQGKHEARGAVSERAGSRGHTSSPISPSTGTVMSTSWLYKPVQRTRRNSPDSLGSDVVMFGK
jgi:hypothetical protein